MKPFLRSLLLSVFFLPAVLRASTNAPMFAGTPGTTLTIQGETYTWTSPATEDATWHVDTYTNATAQTVTVTGKTGAPNLATVSGSSSTGTVAGYLSSGVYGDNHQTSSSDGSWQFNGVTYTHRNLQQDYSVDWNYDGVNSSGSDDYTGLDGHLHNTWSYPAGGNGESFSTFSGGKTPFSSQTQFTVFGTTYQFQDSTSYDNNYYDGHDSGWTDNYTSLLTGGTLKVTRGSNGYSLLIWDPYLGNVETYNIPTVLNSSLAGVIWPARSAPTFAKPQLWLDGKLLNWQSGTITTEGLVTDSYSGAGVTLTVKAKALDFFGSSGSAEVTITSAGGGTGSLGRNGTFTLSGHVLQNASLNQSAPLFTGSKTVLRMAGANHAFTGGFQDSLGNRIDIYTNPSYGKIVLSGSASNPNQASVKATRYGQTYSGTYSNGTFSVAQFNISTPSSQPPIYGPPAFWVRGELYLQNETTRTIYTTAAPNSYSLTLSGTSTWMLAGSDAKGPFSGACSKGPVGVFLVQALDGSSQPIPGAFVPVIPANADGSMHLSWEPAPTGMPPGVRVNDRHLVYLGTAADDTNATATAAYYGSATASDQSDWLLKLRTDGSSTAPYTVTYTDYSTATSSTGSYSAQTHLFQTSAPPPPEAPNSGFPVPVYGVDPNANFALWGLTQPGGGLPPTFIVRGQPWRLAGYDTSTDTATYQGFYNGQQMALGAADASGERRVTLTDPIYNRGSQAATQGSLNSQRRSALLRDGTLVLSGTQSGQQDVVQHADDYKLQTIAADLDIVGNNLSFGILNGDASRAGALFNFADDSSLASLHSILSRPLAQWAWWKAEGLDADSLRKVMWLDVDHRLKLFQAGDYATPAIVLDPAGTSSFRGPVRVPQSGDIPMGIYQEGDPP